jgi:hypothetical protein
MKKINIYHTLMLLIGVLFFYSCSEEMKVYPETRLFMPVLNSNLLPHENTITVDMAKMTKAISYKIELSRDEFATPSIETIMTADNKVVFKDLLWNTKYQVRATAYATEEQYNSKISDLGSVTTDRFPSIMQIPVASDVTDVAAKVRWTTGTASGALITQVKVFDIKDEKLTTPLAVYEVTPAEQTAGQKIINNLRPSTQYQLAIYSESTVRGWEKYVTKDPLPTTGNIVDLRGVDVTPTTLADALTSAPSSATVILDGDKVYTLSANYFFDKPLIIKSGYSLTNTTGAVIDNSVGDVKFELTATANISSIVFDGISFVGDIAKAKYVFNIATAVSATVGELKFVNCQMTNYRDLIRSRVQWTSGSINLLTVDNCILTNFGSNGLLLVDGGANATLPNVVLKNSTFFKVDKLIKNAATKDSQSLVISDCTFSESPKGTHLMEYLKTTNILQGITITNTIFGRGGDNNGNYSSPFIRSGDLPATIITSGNVYKTNDFTITAPVAPATTPIPTFTVYTGSITALWVDPLKGNFNILDSAFAGKSSCGDPRWRKK